MSRILEYANKLSAKEKRKLKQFSIPIELEQAVQAELDKRLNENGVAMSWQTMLEACCHSFLEECKTKKRA